MTSSLYRKLAVPARNAAGPGTEETRSGETLDNDVFAALLGVGAATGDSKQKHSSPGTRITATVETMDGDAAMLPPD